MALDWGKLYAAMNGGGMGSMGNMGGDASQMTPDMQKAMVFSMIGKKLGDWGAGMAAASAPSRMPVPFGVAAAQAKQYASEQERGREDSQLKRMLAMAEMQKLQRGGDAPSAVREYEYYNQLKPEEQERFLNVKRAQQQMNLGDRIAIIDPRLGTPGAYYEKGVSPDQRPELKYDQTTAINAADLQGKPRIAAAVTAAEETAKHEAKKDAEKPKAGASLRSAEQGAQLVYDTIDEALSQADGWTTGAAGALTNSIPGTKAYDLARTLDTVKANIGFDKLAQMRANSPTGGALGSVTENELRLLQSTLASAEQSQSEDQFKRNLGKLKEQYAQSMQNMRKAYEQDYGTAEGFDALMGGEQAAAPLSPEEAAGVNDVFGGGVPPQPAPQQPVPSQSATPAAPQALEAPQPGYTEGGYRFKGGDPADPNNWEKM